MRSGFALWIPAFAGMTLGWSALAAELDPDQQQRFQALTAELRCLVCQNQSISESNAPLAEDLRDQVREQILAGRTDAQIHEYVTARYGDFVLYRPPFKSSTLLLWLGPVGLLVLALGVALVFSRRTRETPAPAADPAAVERILHSQERKP